MTENPREIVLDLLLALERGEDFSHRLIRSVLDKYDYLDTKDKKFIKRLAEGTLERQIEMDYVLDQYSSVPVRKMKPLIRCLMRMSVYQLLYMDNVPDSAACNEACKLAGKRKFQNLKGFVNGVLRKIAANKESLPLPDQETDKTAYLSVKYSCPRWLVEQFTAQYGETLTGRMLEGLLAVHPVSLRFRSVEDAAAVEAAGVTLTQSSYLSSVYTAEKCDNLTALPGFDRGRFTVQDVSSALAVTAAGISPGDRVIDVCAAPGGKSLLASQLAGRNGSVLSRDLTEQKAELIRESAARMRADNVTVQVWDATVPDETLFGTADVVLMDVPCSGLGILGKKRDIKYHVTPESLQSIALLQCRIVENCWQYVKPGGILLYSTCTLNRRENEDMAKWIAEKLPFAPVSLKEMLPQCLLEEKHWCEEQAGRYLQGELRDACIQLYPGVMQADGFFFAKFRRQA